MLTAQGKKTQNIAEYLLYMWQIEDQIRAFNLDIDQIQRYIIDAYDQPETVKSAIRAWYESLIDMMKREGVTEKGHLQLNQNVLIELNDLHQQLMALPAYADYASLYYQTVPMIIEFKSKTNNPAISDIEACFNLMYGLLIMRLKKQPVTPETQQAADQISAYLRKLAAYYKLDKEKGLEQEEE
jgi:hypothetical protein